MLLPKLLWVCAGIVLLMGCGGSAKSTPKGVWTPGVFEPSAQFLNRCAVPRTGEDPATGKPFPDQPGSTLLEKQALRSSVHEDYLWFDQVPDQDPSQNLSTQDYFERLKIPDDRFHFFQKSEDAYREFVLGEIYSHGLRWGLDPKDTLRVTQVLPNSPASAAGIRRGWELSHINQQPLASYTQSALINLLFPRSQGMQISLRLVDANGINQGDFSLQSVQLSVPAVQNTRVWQRDGVAVGYFTFDGFNGVAERDLLAVVQDFQAQNVRELVLDLRHNGGGSVNVAAELAYMVAGKARTSDKVFGQLRFNTKQPASLTEQTRIGFLSSSQGFSTSLPKGTPLPALSLSRLYVLTSNDTCSASEMLINGLRGIGFPVIQIGGTTCGKPYGFYPLSNCGYDYYFVNFTTENALGFSGYATGFQVASEAQLQGSPLGCARQDDFLAELGSVEEPLLAEALNHMSTGRCSTATAAFLPQQEAPRPRLLRGSEVGRLLLLER